MPVPRVGSGRLALAGFALAGLARGSRADRGVVPSEDALQGGLAVVQVALADLAALPGWTGCVCLGILALLLTLTALCCFCA
eukprot:10164056-Alexandrium_andersonii.AAC.1